MPRQTACRVSRIAAHRELLARDIRQDSAFENCHLARGTDEEHLHSWLVLGLSAALRRGLLARRKPPAAQSKPKAAASTSRRHPARRAKSLEARAHSRRWRHRRGVRRRRGARSRRRAISSISWREHARSRLERAAAKAPARTGAIIFVLTPDARTLGAEGYSLRVRQRSHHRRGARRPRACSTAA